MAKLDLTPFLEETFDIQFDKEGKDIVKVKKPTKGLALQISALQVQEHKNDMDYIEDLDKLTLLILNWNTDNKEQGKRVGNLPLDIKIKIIAGYVEFMKGIESNPN
ncbi:hypothetical protein ACOAKC_01120 [Hathewaya histolytica]|uniref:hypothetical protein n=1 Tax=Hathewaya histolytica TaxID=1498 RepID=UPI003B6746D7